MKNFFIYMIPCLAFALSLTSCNDTMDDKAVIDAKYENLDNPTIAMATAVASSYETATATGSISDLANAHEVGFQVSTDETFAISKNYPSEEVAAEFSANLTGLKEKTTYYVRAYVFTKSGRTIYSESTTFTTPKIPIYDVDGSYTAEDYEHGEDGFVVSGKPYTMTITFAEGSDTEVEIFNLWGGGETLMGVYDAESSTITVPTGQNLYDYPDNGYVVANAVNDEMTAYQDDIVLKFTPLGGLIVTGFYEPYLPAADYSFGLIYTSMKHNDDDLVEE